LALFFDPMFDFLLILFSCFSKLSTLSFNSFMAATAVSTHVVERQVDLASAVFILFWFFLIPFLLPFFSFFF